MTDGGFKGGPGDDSVEMVHFVRSPFGLHHPWASQYVSIISGAACPASSQCRTSVWDAGPALRRRWAAACPCGNHRGRHSWVTSADPGLEASCWFFFSYVMLFFNFLTRLIDWTCAYPVRLSMSAGTLLFGVHNKIFFQYDSLSKVPFNNATPRMPSFCFNIVKHLLENFRLRLIYYYLAPMRRPYYIHIIICYCIFKGKLC